MAVKHLVEALPRNAVCRQPIIRHIRLVLNSFEMPVWCVGNKIILLYLKNEQDKLVVSIIQLKELCKGIQDYNRPSR